MKGWSRSVSPFGYAESITAGIVSAVDRDIEAPNNYAIPNTIQTDAAINRGNSGGPLIDSSGKVIGVNVQIATDDGGGGSNNAGVGFAVPSNTVKAVADDLIAGRAIRHPYLGISVGDDPAGAGARVDAVRATQHRIQSRARGRRRHRRRERDEDREREDQLTSVVARHQPGDTLRSDDRARRGDASGRRNAGDSACYDKRLSDEQGRMGGSQSSHPPQNYENRP